MARLESGTYDRYPSPSRRHPGPRARPGRGWTVLRHADGRVRRRGHQDRDAGPRRRSPPARPERGRYLVLVRRGQPQQEADDARPPPAGGPGHRPPARRHVRRGARELSPRRAGALGARLGRAPRHQPAHGHGAGHRLRSDGAAPPGPRLRGDRLGVRRHLVRQRSRRPAAVTTDARLSRLHDGTLHRVRRPGRAPPSRRHRRGPVDRRRRSTSRRSA